MGLKVILGLNVLAILDETLGEIAEVIACEGAGCCTGACVGWG